MKIKERDIERTPSQKRKPARQQKKEESPEMMTPSKRARQRESWNDGQERREKQKDAWS